MSLIKKSLFVLILLLLLFPAIQESLQIFKEPSLNGYFIPRKQTVFSVSTWFTGIYQDSLTNYCKENSGFRSDLVRIYNQADYSLFSIPHAAKIVLGKKGYLFSDEYIDAFTGANFAGKDYCDEKVGLLKKLQDLLWTEKKILLVVILTPDKGTYYPEYIPDRFVNRKKGLTNYGYYSAACAKAGINLIDFNSYFLGLKETAKYPLYPKTGIHWSDYGAVLAADSLLHYLQAKLNFKLPSLVIDSLQKSRVAFNSDDDIEKTMNLMRTIPTPVYAYPRYHFTSDTAQKKPSALIIGDSFYWNWYPGIVKNVFSNDEFWYYNTDIFPESRTRVKQVPQIDVAEAINRQNVIILMQVNGAKGNIGYGFIELALSVLDPSNSREVRRVEDEIRNNRDWMSMVEQKAMKNSRTVEQQLRLDAIYMLDLQKKDKKHKPR